MPLSRSHLTPSVCTQCGQCCHFEEYRPELNLSYHTWALETGQWFAENIDDDPDRPLYYPIVLEDFNGSSYFTCGYLVDNQCTNFDADGNDLRPNRCKTYYCHDSSGNLDPLTDVDVDIIKIIVDNVHGTNLVGE